MKVFMLGWEFPPHISGGLGTACYGLTKGLDEVGVEVCFALPTAVPLGSGQHVQVRSPTDLMDQVLPPEQAGAADAFEMGLEDIIHVFERTELHRLPAVLHAYATPQIHEKAIAYLEQQRLTAKIRRQQAIEQGQPAEIPSQTLAALPPMTSGSLSRDAGAHYAGDLMSQVYRYARLAVELARRESFDIVHAHDWMTYPAGMAVAATTSRPLIVHVHSTEFDRAGDNVNQQVYEIERAGMHAASTVVCVSHLTQNIVVTRYGVPRERTQIVYNAVEPPKGQVLEMPPIRSDEKIVLFLGRLTMQKGPEYFLRAAKRVVEKFENVRFIVAGSGDMINRCIQEAADLRLGRHVTFTGFLRGDDVARVFRLADLYVMPSVSEPFGIAPLEALAQGVPVIISKQSGVSEVLTHALKVDFWDIDEMANKILAVLNHPPLQRTLRQHGQIELYKLSWRDSAQRLKDIYAHVLARRG